MAYRSRRAPSRGRSRRSYSSYRPARGYSRRRTARRSTRRRSTSRTSRIVIQVVGGAGGVAASPVQLGMKGAAPVRARY